MKIETVSQGMSHWYRLVARNGHTLMTSQMYSTKANALRAASKTSTALGLQLAAYEEEN